MHFRRFALYYLPPRSSDWGRAATAWLGWDVDPGHAVAHPDLPGLPAPVAAITATPRKYGLHATIKPPFFSRPGTTARALEQACAAMCETLAPVILMGLSIEALGRFLALRPVGDERALNTLAAACVKALDSFRAPPTEAELARRRANGLSAAQEACLQRWGYPYLMDQFRFHITLSGRLDAPDLNQIRTVLQDHLGPHLPAPFVLDELALVGEAEDGRFHLVHRYPLTGGSTDKTA